MTVGRLRQPDAAVEFFRARCRCRALVAGLVLALPFGHAAADEREELLKLKNTTLTLIQMLVEQGVLDRKKAEALIKQAEQKGEAAVREQRAEPSTPAQAPGSEDSGKQADQGAAPSEKVDNSTGRKNSKSVRVGYVPEFVKEEIRNQVRNDLKDEVVKDVKQSAKDEGWGVPGALPTWVTSIVPYFDMRLRATYDQYGPDNAPFFDWLAINRAGGLSQALVKNVAFFDTTHDNLHFRERVRVGFDATLTRRLIAGFRLATSNDFSPVSNNQTLGNTGQSYEVAIDRAYLQYDYVDHTGNDWFTLLGGRTPNPFFSTDLLYDPDLSMEGFAGTFRLNLMRDDPNVKGFIVPNPIGRWGVNLGPERPNSLFATAGFFPLEDVRFASTDKYFIGAQLGADWLVFDESRLKFAASFYDYHNVTARRNSFDSSQYDWTAPQFMQKGNSLVAINDAKNQTSCNVGSLGAQNVCLVGLASGFQIWNVTSSFDFARFAPVHVMVTLDYAKNNGFNQNYIYREFGDVIKPRTHAFEARLDIGRTQVRHAHDWMVTFAYRYLERDSVLDAFTDSVFHQGGTNTQGWVIGAQYSLLEHTWFNFRWFSTRGIDGPPLVIDSAQLELNARY